MSQEEISNQRMMLEVVHLQRLRAALLVDLNRAYPKRLDSPSLAALNSEHGQRRIVRELCYLKELRFVSVKQGKRWRIAALGRDFLLGLVEANGIMQPSMLPSIVAYYAYSNGFFSLELLDFVSRYLLDSIDR
ncbi:hypothetical protein [Terriglobus saanensis]|uniref:Uncharacterized protein n=1 Tax=Terriglobus saanensis (strain ATCC BAA-1853 / DSM 23119 / SP1PR4) TaxID=401053 RepID=E8V2K5_TERSS|nr:hypothetical protein [Terriglobus saanensis]ADV82423.1 hypothetical protein AciPR4_1606 [Terriglobus saanensis SP1PR4]